MQIIFVNGRRRQTDWREMREVLAHPASIGLFLLGIFLFRAMPFGADFPTLAPRFEALFWAHVVIVYVVGYLGALALWERTGRPLWTVLLQGGLAALMTATGIAVYFLAGQPVGVAPGATLAFWLFLWAALLFSELLFMAFVYDLARPRPSEAAAAPGEMRVLFVTGQRRGMTFRDLYAVLLHPANVAMVLATVGAMALLHPYPVLQALPAQVAVPFWFHVLALFYLLFLTQAWFCRRTGMTFVVPLALLICSTLVTASSGLFLAHATGSAVARDEIVAYAMLHWSVLIFVEFFVAVFVLDRALAPPGTPAPVADLVAAPPEPPAAAPPVPAPSAPPPGPMLRLQGAAIPADEVLVVVAEEHYLRVVTAERTRLLRGRMADVEAQMPEGLGMRVHRSHWVSGRVVTGLRRTDAGWSVVCTCGRELPVVRGRQGGVREWAQSLGAAA